MFLSILSNVLSPDEVPWVNKVIEFITEAYNPVLLIYYQKLYYKDLLSKLLLWDVFVIYKSLNWNFNDRRSWFPCMNAIASHKKFRNIALNFSFRTAQE